MSSYRGQLRLGHSHRRQAGAVAVEFALLFPLFMMMVVGMISAGFALFHHIEMTQAARDAGRYGATLPIDPAGSTVCSGPSTPPMGVGCWLKSVSNVAAATAGWSPPATLAGPLDLSNGDGYLCVAYVSGGEGAIPDRTLATGTPRPGDPSSGSAPCFVDTLAGPRVQVVIRRATNFNALLFSSDLQLRTSTVLPYERDAA